jgi:outer membrane protein TolC
MHVFKILITFGLIQPVAFAAEQIAPMSLDVCQDFALEFSPSLGKQRLNYSNLVESVAIAKSIYDPVLRVSRTWENEDDPKRTVASIRQQLPAQLQTTITARQEERNGEEFTNYALNLSKTLLGGGSLLEGRLPLERAWIQRAKEANGLSLEQRRLYLDVTRTYYSIVRNKLTLHLRQLQLQRAERNLEHAEVKEDPLDIATAKLRIPESELDVIRARRAIANGLLDLSLTIGMPVGQPMSVDTQLVYQVRAINLKQDLANALENHETILNARLDLELDHMEAKVARTRRLPELRAEVSMQEDDLSSSDSRDVRADLVLEWPWMDRRDRAEYRQREYDLQRSELSLFEAQQSVEQQIKSQAARVIETERSVVLQGQRVTVLEQQFRLYQDRWENGEINILEYIRSQNDLENARVQWITEQTQYLELRAEYDFNIGK